MVDKSNIITEFQEDESTHSIVYIHSGEIVVVTS